MRTRLRWPAGLRKPQASRASSLASRFRLSQVALPASALRWLTSPPADAPAASGMRKVGRADIDAIRELTHSYREMDNRLGGGKLRSRSRRTWTTRSHAC